MAEYSGFDWRTRRSFNEASLRLSRVAGLRRSLTSFCHRRIALAILVLGTGCHENLEPAAVPKLSSAPSGRGWFEDVTEHAEVDFLHDVGAVGTYFMPESLGSGVAIFDFDDDGRMD